MKWRRKKSSGEKGKRSKLVRLTTPITSGKKGKRSKLVKPSKDNIHPVLLAETVCLSDSSENEDIDRYSLCLADQASVSTNDNQSESENFDYQSKACPENDAENGQAKEGIINQDDPITNMFDLQKEKGIISRYDSKTNSAMDTVISSQTIQTSHLPPQKAKYNSKSINDNIDDEFSFMIEALQRIRWPSCDQRALTDLIPKEATEMNIILLKKSLPTCNIRAIDDLGCKIVDDATLNELMEYSKQKIISGAIIKSKQKILDVGKRSVIELGDLVENYVNSSRSDSTDDDSKYTYTTTYADGNESVCIDGIC